MCIRDREVYNCGYKSGGKSRHVCEGVLRGKMCIRDRMAISPEDLKELRAIMQEMMAAYGNTIPEEWLPDGAQDFFKLQASDYGKIGGWPVMLPPGHLTPGFQNILKRGYGDIRKQAQDWLDEHEGNIQGDNMGKYMFYKAATVACDGAITLTRRYADLAREKAKTAPTAERKAELEKMAVSLDWIAENPARTFWEACLLYTSRCV